MEELTVKESEFTELKVVEEKGLQDVQVFRICECDAVAAYSIEEAKNYYKELTGGDESSLYFDEDVEIIPLETKIWNDEEMTNKKTLQEILEECWEGKPQIAISWIV
jgi:hypothetical protein